jgi:hypothetical protein
VDGFATTPFAVTIIIVVYHLGVRRCYELLTSRLYYLP